MKKNILYISSDFNLACGVSKHVFTLLTSEELKKEFNLYFITNGGDALHKLSKAGINYSIFDFRTDKTFHFDLLTNLKWLKQYCKEKEIDLIHSHHRYPALLAYLLSKSLNLKTVVTVHNFALGLKKLSYRSNLIIAVSNAVKDHLIRYFRIDSNTVNVFYHCLPPVSALFKKEEMVKSSYEIPTENLVLLYAGRISEEKGLETLISSFQTLKISFKHTSLVLVGSHSFSKILKRFKSDTDNIVLLPPMENLQDLFSIADLVVLPSLEEGLGYTMLEAGLYKVPFIGSRAGGIAEFIEDGINGYLFESGNAADLSNKIEYVLTHPDEAAVTAERLHKKVLDECNCKKYMKKLSGIYNQLLSDK